MSLAWKDVAAMMHEPKTVEQAIQYRYGRWAGNPKGYSYSPDRCAAEISSGWLYCQCTRNNGYGPSELYCKQHAKKVKSK